ncbi:MAG TPA: HAMP domain-containing protein, partial [Rudaea sp.]
MLIALLLSYVVTKSITAPLSDAVRVTRAVATGDLSVSCATIGKDEPATLLRSMEGMVAELRRFAQAQTEMATAHGNGMISHTIDASTFSGAYSQMAVAINDLVATHVAVKTRMVEMVTGYSNGDLAQQMEDLPGEERRISDAINAVRESIGAISREIKALVAAAGAG